MKNKIFSFVKTIKYCLKLSWHVSKFYTIFRLINMILISLLPYISMFATKTLLDILSITADDRKLLRAIVMLVIIIAVSILIKILLQLDAYVQKIHSEIVMYNINNIIMFKSMKISIKFYDSPDYLDTLQAVQADYFSINSIIWNVFFSFSNIVSLIIALIMIGTQHLSYAFLLIMASIPTAIVSRHFSRISYNWRLENLVFERQQSYINSISSDSYFAFDIRLHNLSDFFINRYKKYWNICFKAKNSLRNKRLLCLIPTYILPEFLILIFMISISQGIIEKEYSVGDFILYFGLFTSLLSATESVISSLSLVYEDKLKIDTVDKFDSYSEEDDDSGDLKLEDVFSIEFINVSFKYPKSDTYVLNNLSFKVEQKKRLCILGINGSGKSTIIKLMMRFYDVTEGEILINSINIKEYSIVSLRKAFSVVFQDYINYAFSLRENLFITDLDKKILTDKKAEKILDIVCALDLLKKLPNGLDTYLQRIFDNLGYEPSCGEQQKIALARAINRECKVLVLDEPTAALDPESEYKLFYNIKTQLTDKIIIFTSHRLSAVHLADNIILIENGKVLEEGSHSELLNLNKEYARLYRLQSDLYK